MNNKKGFWKRAGRAIGKIAPVLGAVVGGPGGATMGAVISKALGVANSEEAILEAIKVDPNAAVKLREIESSQTVELERLAYQTASAEIQAETSRLVEINTTMRAELTNGTSLQKNWRPLFGYISAITMGIMLLSIIGSFVYLVFFKLDDAPEVIAAASGMTTALFPIVAAMLAVLGVNVTSRSRDKAELLNGASNSFLRGLFK